VTDTIPSVRPGLSADSEIIAAHSANALAIPIQSLTVRQEKDLKGYVEKADSAAVDSTSAKKKNESSEVEGVFVVVDGRAEFRQIKIGIAGQTHFEILSGLEEGDKVVSGNYRAIRDLKDGQRVKITTKAAKK